MRFEQTAIAREELRHASRERFVFSDVGVVAGLAARAPLAPHGAQAVPEARQPMRRLERCLGLGREVYEELVDVGHVPRAVDPDRLPLILHLPNVAGRAVQPDHLDAADFRARHRHADRQPVRVAGMPGVAQQSETLDVVEKRSHVHAAVACRHLDVEREQPVDRIELAALRQMVKAGAVGVRETIPAAGARRRRQRGRLADVLRTESAGSEHPPADETGEKDAGQDCRVPLAHMGP